MTPVTKKLLSPRELSAVLVTALEGAGLSVAPGFDGGSRPMQMRVDGKLFRVFLWNIRTGGATRNVEEYRVQTRRPADVPLLVPRKRTLVLGYHAALDVFAGWDPRSHPNPGRSSSLQVPLSLLEEAASAGIAARTRKVRRGNEVVIAFAPAAIATYLDVAPTLPPPRASASAMKAWARAGSGEEVPEVDLPKGGPRREVLRHVRVKIRDQRFRSSVINVYRGRCAFCGIGAGLIEAAHIQGVGKGGPDEIDNGLAACPTHHLAFDRGFLVVRKGGAIEVNRKRLREEGAGAAEAKALKAGLFSTLKVPAAKRLRPSEVRLAAHRQRWLSPY
jgi:hypothetical protein